MIGGSYEIREKNRKCIASASFQNIGILNFESQQFNGQDF